MKIQDVYKDLSKDKDMLDFSNYSVKSIYYDSNKLVVGKMKDETGGVAIEEFVGLNPQMYWLLVDNSSEQKKVKGVNKDVERMRHSDIKMFCWMINVSMNRIQNKNYRIGTYEINKNYLSCFDDKIYILNNGSDGLAVGF